MVGDKSSLTGQQKPYQAWPAQDLPKLTRELEITNKELEQAEKTEIYNPDTGVGETHYGLPLGFIRIKIGTIDNVDDVSGGEGYVIELSVVSTTGSPIPPGPVPKYSEPPTLPKDQQLVFNQEFQLAPIRTIHAALVIRLKRGKADTIGECHVNLADLKSQETQTFRLPLTEPQGDSGKGVVLNFTMRFQFSKVLPLKEKIKQLTDEITALKWAYYMLLFSFM